MSGSIIDKYQHMHFFTFNTVLLISDFRRDLNIVYFLLGISPASNCSWPTFRNPVSVPSSKAGCRAFEGGTDTGFRNVSQLQFDAGEIPKKKIQYSNHGESLKSIIQC